MDRTSTLIKAPLSFPPREDTGRRWLSMNQEVGPHQSLESASTLMLDFPDSGTVRNECLLFKSNEVYGIFVKG